MKRTVLFLCYFQIYFLAVAQDCSKIKLSSSILKTQKTKNILLLIADDRSGSTTKGTQPARFSEQDYRKLLQVFLDRGYTGQFAIRIIGNTPHSGFEEALSFESRYLTLIIPPDTPLTPKAKMRCINQKIEDTNRVIVDRSKKKVEDYVKRIIVPKAINYKPNGLDQTDIFSALRDIEMKLNIADGFNKIIVVVMSDGQDSNKKKLKLETKMPINLILIGWPLDNNIKDQKEIHLGSADDFVTWFKNI
jgi:hypothetical protein